MLAEIWHIIGPLIETPFRGGSATWMDDILLHMNRRGFMEETHWAVAYSPVLDDAPPGGIGGVIGTVNEITEKIVGERHGADRCETGFEFRSDFPDGRIHRGNSSCYRSDEIELRY